MTSAFKYLPNQSLLTDFYQLTMAQAYYDSGRAKLNAVFHLFYRHNPFDGNFALAAGIEDALQYVRDFHFDEDSINFLKSVTKKDGSSYFSKPFLNYLRELIPEINIYGVESGTIIFPHEPILRVEGPLALCQILETPLLNIINFQTLIATKAARIFLSANNKPLSDFGLRRAQGFDGAISATKAAYIGGIDSSSNVWAAMHLGIPASGTQAHSFIMSYKNQLQAFSDFSQTYGDNCVLLVDTYDPIDGIKDAVKVFTQLAHEKLKDFAIRLDSGDLSKLSFIARKMLDDAKLYQCKIIVSGDLCENKISELESARAPIDAYGVGTKLICAHDEPALGGVYKLAAIHDQDGWRDTFKLSATKGKETWPGQQSIMRYFLGSQMVLDQIYNPKTGPSTLINEAIYNNKTELHKLLFGGSKITCPLKPLSRIRESALKALSNLPADLKLLKHSDNSHPVIFDDTLIIKKRTLKKEEEMKSSKKQVHAARL